MIYTKQFCHDAKKKKEISKAEAFELIAEHELTVKGLPSQIVEEMEDDNYELYQNYISNVFLEFEKNGFYECGKYVLKAKKFNQSKYINEYNKQTYENLSIRMKKGYKEKLGKLTTVKNMSAASLIMHLIDKEIDNIERN